MATLINYAELCAHSCFSFLHAASQPGELVEQAAFLELPAIGITDRNGVYAIPRAYEAIQKFPNLKLITGAEVTIQGFPSLTFLAKNRKAYGLLCRLITQAHAEKEKGHAFLTRSECFEFLNQKEAEGLFILLDFSLKDSIESQLQFFHELQTLQPHNIRCKLSRFLDGRDDLRTSIALKIRDELKIPIIATNDVYYHHPDKRALQDTLVAIRENIPLSEVGEKVFSNGERYLKTKLQMSELFSDLPEALHETIFIGNQCTFSPSELKYRYPSEWIPKGHTAQKYLEKITLSGAIWRYPNGVPLEVKKQLEHELKLVSELQFADYFLTIWEIVQFAKENKILCQGRGSAANSIICYCLGITAIDPVKMNLLFERFISAERGEPPDIDVDFEHERREEVIQHIYEKYGRHRAGMVAAVVTYHTKSSRRDISKALGIEPEQITEHSFGKKLMEEIYEIPRHLSIHTGGFTLSADPIIETVPIEPARMPGRTIVQWNKDDLATIGLLKVDILALGIMTVLSKTFSLLEHQNNYQALALIPINDVKTYQMIQKADTIGVFQIESRAQMSMLGRLLPKTFYDLVIQVAIVRPGPIVGQMVHPYLKRRRGIEKPSYPNPELIPILGRTLGVPLFQEQVMKMAITLAGFSPGEADELRRSIGAWRASGSLEKMGKRLMVGLLKSGLPEEFVERIFAQIQGFAEYGFPESHAASFGLLAYTSAYLKCHHPTEFLCATLNSQPMGFYSPHTLIDDGKRHGVIVLPINPNHSQWDCTLELIKQKTASLNQAKHSKLQPPQQQKALRLGLRLVHGIHRSEAERIIQARKKRPFSSLEDFLHRTQLRLMTLEKLAMGDVFKVFNLSQREALWKCLAYHCQNELFLNQVIKQNPKAAQLSLFSELTHTQAIHADYLSYGLSLRGHPMQAIRFLLPERAAKLNSRIIKTLAHGTKIQAAGMVIVRQRPPTAKGSAFSTLEDEYGFLDIILHPKVFDQYEEVFRNSSFLLITGKIQKDANTTSILVQKLQKVELTQELNNELEQTAERADSKGSSHWLPESSKLSNASGSSPTYSLGGSKPKTLVPSRDFR